MRAHLTLHPNRTDFGLRDPALYESFYHTFNNLFQESQGHPALGRVLEKFIQPPTVMTLPRVWLSASVV